MPSNVTVQVAVNPPSRVATVMMTVSSPNAFLQETVAMRLPSDSGVTVTYAYGSVMEFVYRRIAGIEAKEAGFKKITIAPHPVKGLPSLKAEYDSAAGKIVSGYEQKNGKIVFTAEIPRGVRAKIVLPEEAPFMVSGGTYTYEREWGDLHCEPFTPESYVTEVFDQPKAVQAFNEVFGGIFTGTETAWMKNRRKTLGFMAKFRDMEGKMKLSDFPEMHARANQLFLLDHREPPSEWISEETYEENIVQICEKAKSVREFCLMTPFYMERDRSDEMRSMTERYAARLNTVAKRYGVKVIDLQKSV